MVSYNKILQEQAKNLEEKYDFYNVVILSLKKDQRKGEWDEGAYTVNIGISNPCQVSTLGMINQLIKTMPKNQDSRNLVKLCFKESLKYFPKDS